MAQGASRVIATAFTTGRKSSVGTSAVQIIASPTAAKSGVQVIAADSNTDKVYLGTSAVTTDASDSTDGFPLSPGDSLFVPIDDASKVYVRAVSGSQKVFFLVT